MTYNPMNRMKKLLPLLLAFVLLPGATVDRAAAQTDETLMNLGGLEMTADVQCPYCGETVEILLDGGGGRDQRYVEDCEVCCRPWSVRVVFGPDWRPTVEIERDA